MRLNGEWQELVDRAVAQGWVARPTKKGVMFLSPDGRSKVMVHGTPSDRRALLNARAAFRAGGLDLSGSGGQ